MGYPTPLGRRTLGRVARAAEHRGVGDVERRTACGERNDVVDGQVGRGVGGALVARAPVAVLATPGTEHAGAEPLPGPRAVQGVVPAAVGLAGVLGAATTRAAGDDTADRAQLHPQIVGGLAGAVYSPAVLGVRDQSVAAYIRLKAEAILPTHDQATQPVTLHSHRIMPPTLTGRMFLLVAMAAAMFAIAGCAFLRTPKANVAVGDIATAFPTVQRLGAVVYMFEAGQDGEADCEYFEYQRGAFTSKPQDEFCRVFDFDDRHPGGGNEGPVPVPLDDQARADLVDFKKAFEGVGASIDYMNAVLASDGSVGPDSGFDFDRCVAYWYDPGWTALPNDDPDSVSTGIDANWYKTDSCP